MKIHIRTKNTELSVDAKEKFEAKLEKLKKYKSGVKDLLVATVDISHDTHHKKGAVFTVEMNVDIPKKFILRVSETAASAASAFDMAFKKLERQARDLKDRAVSHKKGE